MLNKSKLRIMRESKGLTQEETAKRICLTRQTYAKHEIDGKFKDMHWCWLSKLFDCSVEDLKDKEEAVCADSSEQIENI